MLWWLSMDRCKQKLERQKCYGGYKVFLQEDKWDISGETVFVSCANKFNYFDELKIVMYNKFA